MNTSRLTQHQSDVLRTHLDPKWGSAHWIDRAGRLGMGGADEVHTIEDIKRLGPISPHDLRERPLWDYIPRRYHDQSQRLVIGQTGGTTGAPVWTAYLDEEFRAAFVQPFVDVAEYVDFPRGESWLFVGPSGPHIIGQAARAIARAVGSAEPFTVDFDPRWARKLTRGSVAAARYLQHVTDQAMQIIESQPVGVLFATPPVLLELAERMTPDQRQRVRGVHYGGMAITEDVLLKLQCECFPNAVHLSGYGNTLLGCCPELTTQSGRALDYFPHGDRLLLNILDDNDQPAPFGRVVASRFDHSFLIINLYERDYAHRVDLPRNAPSAFQGPGLRNPHTPAPVADTVPVGLY